MLTNVKIKKPVDSSLSKTAISLGGGGELAPMIARGFEASLSETIAESGNLLRIAIQNKIAVVKPAHQRQKKWIGKVINTLLKMDHAHIELHGIELLALTKILKEDVDVAIYPKSIYLVPFNEAERVLSRLKDIKWC